MVLGLITAGYGSGHKTRKSDVGEVMDWLSSKTTLEINKT